MAVPIMSTSLRPQRVVLDSLPTPMFPAFPSDSRLPAVSQHAGFNGFAVPPTPELSPMATMPPSFQTFAVDQTEARPQAEPETKPEVKPEAEPEAELEHEDAKAKTIVLCFDGTGNKFGEVCPWSTSASINRPFHSAGSMSSPFIESSARLFNGHRTQMLFASFEH